MARDASPLKPEKPAVAGPPAQPRYGLVLVPPEETRPLQRAQLVWRRAISVVEPLDQHDVLAVVLELLRTAHHDVATMSHALTLGRARVREHPADVVARQGTRVLEQAIAFMGVEPRSGDR